jgi:hypothetical protein
MNTIIIIRIMKTTILVKCRKVDNPKLSGPILDFVVWTLLSSAIDILKKLCSEDTFIDTAIHVIAGLIIKYKWLR